jgi:hypothetical protein
MHMIIVCDAMGGHNRKKLARRDPGKGVIGCQRVDQLQNAYTSGASARWRWLRSIYIELVIQPQIDQVRPADATSFTHNGNQY